MKIKNSLKALKGRHRDNQLVRRKGRIYIINKTAPRYKARQGLGPRAKALGLQQDCWSTRKIQFDVPPHPGIDFRACGIFLPFASHCP